MPSGVWGGGCNTIRKRCCAAVSGCSRFASRSLAMPAEEQVFCFAQISVGADDCRIGSTSDISLDGELGGTVGDAR